jgi:hypothetical protein
VADITFDQIVNVLINATKQTFLNYMGIELITGEAEKRVTPVDSDITGIVGVALIVSHKFRWTPSMICCTILPCSSVARHFLQKRWSTFSNW